MEYIDIFDENNNPIGEIKEKNKAHEDGNFHRTAHIWIMNNKKELLLQKRSPTQKSHPNCWDISGAGHIRAGEIVLQGAIRELKEELGVSSKEDELNFISIVKSTKDPKNCEFGYVYIYQNVIIKQKNIILKIMKYRKLNMYILKIQRKWQQIELKDY